MKGTMALGIEWYCGPLSGILSGRGLMLEAEWYCGNPKRY